MLSKSIRVLFSGALPPHHFPLGPIESIWFLLMFLLNCLLGLYAGCICFCLGSLCSGLKVGQSCLALLRMKRRRTRRSWRTRGICVEVGEGKGVRTGLGAHLKTA
jgi:hypothetical protein